MKKYDMIVKNKLKLMFSSFVLAAGMFLPGCWSESSQNSKLVVINVLDKKDYEDCHIKGSIHIPFEDLEDRMKQMSKQDEYVFYCSNYACTAAPFAANSMKQAGFDKAAVYHGGIVEWYQKKYPYIGPAKFDYLEEENKPLSDNDHSGVTVLDAEELKEKMIQAGLVS